MDPDVEPQPNDVMSSEDEHVRRALEVARDAREVDHEFLVDPGSHCCLFEDDLCNLPGLHGGHQEQLTVAEYTAVEDHYGETGVAAVTFLLALRHGES